MADLRIVDAPEIPTEDITGEEKLPTGGSGNYSIALDSVADYTKTKKDLADNTSVDNKVNGVRQELDAHIEDLLNPHQVTKGQIGLGNVDNTADADKPVSNSTQAAIISAVAPKADKTYVNTALSSKAEKTYVDNQLTLKANKADVYTKQESDDLVNNSISTALTPVNTSLDLAKRGIANRYDSSLTYYSGERVVLVNGDIVKSTIDGNTNDPNVDMTGWRKPQASDVFDESGSTQQEVNNEQDLVNTQQAIINNYIVYAEKYGTSLNEAMTAINTEFAGKRVRVYVPSDFPVTATVNLNIDCDLDLSTLQIQNDIGVIFEPIEGWSGTTTPCDVYVNNKSCRIGWNLKKALGIVSINKMRFLNIGNEVANTSASYWMGFSISTVNIKRIDLYEPTTINSYVVPNTVIGDAAGTNRNIIIDGVMTASDFVSDINIHNHVAIDLKTKEDSDALVVNTGATSIANSRYNIDIYNGYAKNCQKRQYKFMLPNNPTGIRLHGDSVAIGDGTTYSALDMYGTGTIEASGSILGIGFMIGINSTESVKFEGVGYSANFIMDRTAYLGNQVRGLNQTGTGTSDIELYSLFGVGGTELFVNSPTHRLRIQKCKHTTWLRTFSATGNYSINALEVNLADISTESITRSAYLIAAGGAGRGVIRNIAFRSTSATKQQHFIQSLATENLTVENGEIFDEAITGSFIRAVTAKKIKLRNLKAPSAGALIRLESTCDQVLMDQCVKPTSNMLYYDVNANSTNVVELNTQTF